MSLMPLHMYILHYVKMLCVMCTDGVTCLRANASCESNYVLSTSKHFFRMQLLRTLTVILHILHITHHIRECIEMFITSTSRTVYGNTTSPSSFIHETPHHTNLFLFIAIYYLFEDVIFKCDGGYRSHVIGRSVGSRLVSSRLVSSCI